jgi:hypothetical protein
MIDYAPTAEDTAGKRRPESSGKGQPLRTHLENVAALAVLPLIQSSPWIYPALLTAIADTHHQPNALRTKTKADPVFWSGFDEGGRWLTDLGLLPPTLPPFGSGLLATFCRFIVVTKLIDSGAETRSR